MRIEHNMDFVLSSISWFCPTIVKYFHARAKHYKDLAQKANHKIVV